MRRNSGFAVIAMGVLASTAVADEVIYRGNLHRSLGRATLEIDPFDILVVGNIGSSGLDGVAIDVGQAEAFDLTLVPPPNGLPPGAAERFRFHGQVAGNPVTLVGEIEFTQNAANLTVEASFPGLGNPPRLVEAYLGGALVGVVTVAGPDPIASAPQNSWPSEVGVRKSLASHGRPAILCQWSQPRQLVLFGGGVVVADEVRVIGLSPGNDLDFVAQTDGTGSDVPELFIADEETTPDCPGDLDGDGDVDLADLAILLANFGAMGGVTSSDGDIDGDSDVDLADMAVLLAAFGMPCD